MFAVNWQNTCKISGCNISKLCKQTSECRSQLHACAHEKHFCDLWALLRKRCLPRCRHVSRTPLSDAATLAAKSNSLAQIALLGGWVGGWVDGWTALPRERNAESVCGWKHTRNYSLIRLVMSPKRIPRKQPKRRRRSYCAATTCEAVFTSGDARSFLDVGVKIWR